MPNWQPFHTAVDAAIAKYINGHAVACVDPIDEHTKLWNDEFTPPQEEAMRTDKTAQENDEFDAVLARILGEYMMQVQHTYVGQLSMWALRSMLDEAVKFGAIAPEELFQSQWDFWEIIDEHGNKLSPLMLANMREMILATIPKIADKNLADSWVAFANSLAGADALVRLRSKRNLCEEAINRVAELRRMSDEAEAHLSNRKRELREAISAAGGIKRGP